MYTCLLEVDQQVDAAAKSELGALLQRCGMIDMTLPVTKHAHVLTIQRQSGLYGLSFCEAKQDATAIFHHLKHWTEMQYLNRVHSLYVVWR